MYAHQNKKMKSSSVLLPGNLSAASVNHGKSLNIVDNRFPGSAQAKLHTMINRGQKATKLRDSMTGLSSLKGPEGRAGGVGQKFKQSAPGRQESRQAVLQAEWEKNPDENVWIWSPLIDGVAWSCDSTGMMWYNICDPESIEDGSYSAYQQWEGASYTAEEWDRIEFGGRPLPEKFEGSWPGTWGAKIIDVRGSLMSKGKILKAFGKDSEALMRHTFFVRSFIESLLDPAVEPVVSQRYLDRIIDNYPKKGGYSRFNTALSATALEPVAAKSLIKDGVAVVGPGQKFRGMNKKGVTSTLDPDYLTQDGVGDAQRVQTDARGLIGRVAKAVKDKVGTYPDKKVDVVIILEGLAIEDVKVQRVQIYDAIKGLGANRVFVYVQGRSFPLFP